MLNLGTKIFWGNKRKSPNAHPCPSSSVLFSLIQYHRNLELRHTWLFLLSVWTPSFYSWRNCRSSLSLNFHDCKMSRFKQMTFKSLLALEWNFAFSSSLPISSYWDQLQWNLDSRPWLALEWGIPVPTRYTKTLLEACLNNAEDFSPSESSICFFGLVGHEVCWIPKAFGGWKPYLTVRLFQKYQEKQRKWFFYLWSWKFVYLSR